MDYQEQFFKEKIKFLHEEMDKKEENFEKQQQEKREMVMQSNAGTANAEENRRRYDQGSQLLIFMATLFFSHPRI